MSRVIWKGAVSFGLVHIPIALMPATVQRGIDFDWIDRRSMDPVGYKRINNVTGKEIESENIVHGIAYEKHRYIVLSDEEIRAAYPAATQTVDIVSFVKAEQIPFLYLDTPYFLAPEKRGERAYALLRQALEKSGRLALANVVLHTKQHMAVVIPMDRVLVLNTLRWGNEVRSSEEFGLKDEVANARIGQRELEMAERLIADRSEDWDSARYEEGFSKQIMALVERKAHQGKLETVGSAEPAPEDSGAEIISLTELLKRSLAGKGKATRAKGKPAGSASRGRRSKAG